MSRVRQGHIYSQNGLYTTPRNAEVAIKGDDGLNGATGPIGYGVIYNNNFDSTLMIDMGVTGEVGYGVLYGDNYDSTLMLDIGPTGEIGYGVLYQENFDSALIIDAAPTGEVGYGVLYQDGFDSALVLDVGPTGEIGYGVLYQENFDSALIIDAAPTGEVGYGVLYQDGFDSALIIDAAPTGEVGYGVLYQDNFDSALIIDAAPTGEVGYGVLYQDNFDSALILDVGPTGDVGYGVLYQDNYDSALILDAGPTGPTGEFHHPPTIGSGGYFLVSNANPNIKYEWTTSMELIHATKQFHTHNLNLFVNGSSDVSGHIEISGNFKTINKVICQDITTLSDKTEKKNINNSTLGIEFINHLEPKLYEFINGSDEKHIGLISQDIEQIIERYHLEPSLTKEETINLFISNESGKHYVNYQKIIMPLIQSVKTLTQQNNELQQKIDICMQKINHLTSIISS